jgi:hypothetical protein
MGMIPIMNNKVCYGVKKILSYDRNESKTCRQNIYLR